MSAEIDINIRYGLAGQKGAKRVESVESEVEEVKTKVFTPDEDKRWRTGILTRKSKSYPSLRRSPNYEKEAQRLDQKVAKAREEGMVPFRIVGPSEDVVRAVAEIGLTDIEYVL